MSVQAGGEPRCGIGARLRAGRERKGLTILQAAEKLHLDPQLLESLEAEAFAVLGAPVYVRGHMRHYAELVGEQAPELLALYSQGTAVAQPDLTRIPKGEPAGDTRNLVVPGVVVITGFAIVAAVWWVLTWPFARLPQANTVVAVASGNATSGPGGTRAGQAEPSVATDSPSGAATAAAAATVAAQTTAVAASNATAAVPTGLSAPATQLPKQAQLTLRFSGKSWAEVYDSTGARLFYAMGAASTVRTFRARAPLRIVLGNAPDVVVEVDGHAANLAALTHTDGSAQFLLSRSGRASRAQP